MTDAEFEELKAKLLALAQKWIDPLGLRWWHIDMAYERVPDKTAQTDRQVSSNREAAFCCECRWQYLDAIIYCNMPVLMDLDDEDLERIFVHELGHILINETRQANDDDWIYHEERVATTLAKAFLWLRAAVEEEARAKTEAEMTTDPAKLEKA